MMQPTPVLDPLASSAPHGHDSAGRKQDTGFWRAAPAHAEWHIAAALAGGLALDASFGWPGQIAATLWIAGVFFWLLVNGGAIEKRVLIACLIIAGMGEVFFSLGWGLYDYQFRNIPAFVPPGHALLMTLGILLARRAPAWIIWLVPALVLPYVLFGLWQGWDRTGTILFVVFLACLFAGKARSLYATMFMLALLLEIYGTWLGNWTWRPLAPWINLSNTNPPASSGAFYCALDLIVLATIRALFDDSAGKQGAVAWILNKVSRRRAP
jgi:hypothetical protein